MHGDGALNPRPTCAISNKSTMHVPAVVVPVEPCIVNPLAQLRDMRELLAIQGAQLREQEQQQREHTTLTRRHNELLSKYKKSTSEAVCGFVPYRSSSEEGVGAGGAP